LLAVAVQQGWRRQLPRLLARLHQIFDEEVDGRLRSREAHNDDGETRKNDFLDLLLDATVHDDYTAFCQWDSPAVERGTDPEVCDFLAPLICAANCVWGKVMTS
jgi:hypothetical protein